MKLTEAQLPFRDKPFEVFNVSNWLQMIIGVLVLVVIFSIVKPIWERISQRIPVIGQQAAPWPIASGNEHVERADDPAAPIVRILQ